MKIITGLLLFVVLSLSTLHFPIGAQSADEVSAAGLTISPAIFEVTANPGESVRKKFFVQNISGQPVPVSVTMERLRPYEQEIDLRASESFNASQWVSIDEPHHILDDEERRELTATITIPDNAEPGGHYATIVMQPLAPVTSNEQSTARVAPHVGLLVFITVPGDARYDIALRNDVGLLQWSRNVTIDPSFRNTGNMHILPSTKVIVRNIFGSVKDEVEIRPAVVLPNTIREFPASWDKPGLIGIYSAETIATYGSAQSVLSSGKNYFLVFRPLPLLLIIALIYFGGRFVRRTHPRWGQAIRAFREAGKKERKKP